MFLTKWQEKDNWLNDYDPFTAISLFGGRRSPSHFGNEPAFVAPVDVTESDTEFKVALEVAGMEKDDIKIEMENNVLTLSGEKKYSSENKDENSHRVERRYGSFSRSIKFNGIEPEKVTASYKNGVLEVTVPKVESVKPKKIAIG